MPRSRSISPTWLHGRALRTLVANVLALSTAAATCAVVVQGCGDSGGAAGAIGPEEDRRCRPTERVDAQPRCTSWSVNVTGDLATCGLGDAGYGVGDDCAAICGRSVNQCRLTSASTSTGAILCEDYCAVDGRRPEGLDPIDDAGHDLGSHFARMAFHEAAAVDAFDAMIGELRAHGAPASLLRSARRARRDEVRHAAMARGLARRFGGRSRAPKVARPAPRSLEAIALENAREGCARETLGVLIGLHQAAHAKDPAVRAFYARVADDEARHAALSFRLHAWLLPQLSRRAQASVRREVRRSLERMQVPALPADASHELGLPSVAAFDAAKRALAAALA